MRLKITLLLAFAALTCKATAGADERSSVVLAKISTTLKGYGNYEVFFRASAGGMEDLDGYYLVSGDHYCIKMPAGEQIGNGVVRYEISHANREIIIDNTAKRGNDIFTNPAQAFEFASDQFDSNWVESKIVEGRKCDVIRLKPIDKAQGNMAITLYVASTTGLPAAIDYDYDGGSLHIAISNIRKLDKVDQARFTFKKSSFPGYEVIDFR